MRKNFRYLSFPKKALSQSARGQEIIFKRRGSGEQSPQLPARSTASRRSAQFRFLGKLEMTWGDPVTLSAVERSFNLDFSTSLRSGRNDKEESAPVEMTKKKALRSKWQIRKCSGRNDKKEALRSNDKESYNVEETNETNSCRCATEGSVHRRTRPKQALNAARIMIQKKMSGLTAKKRVRRAAVGARLKGVYIDVHDRSKHWTQPVLWYKKKCRVWRRRNE